MDSVEDICSLKLDENLKEHILSSFDNDKLSLSDICYLFLDFRNDQLMKDIVESVCIKLYYKKVSTKVICKFLTRWNVQVCNYNIKGLYIDPIKFFIDIAISDVKFITEFILATYEYHVERKPMHELLVIVLRLYKDELRKIISCIKETNNEMNILELYIKECDYSRDAQGIAMAIFDPEIVNIIIELTNPDLKNTNLTYRNVKSYIGNLMKESV